MNDESQSVEELAIEATVLLIGLKGMHGENLLLFREAQHLALLCEVNEELEDWLRMRSQLGVVAEWSWRHTKAHLESRAANRAFDRIVNA